MNESQKLLADYAATGSEAAFRELVSRYVDLVFSTALRSVDGDAPRAEEVAQTVFIDLAQQAPKLSSQTRLGGWLHRHTCFVAAKLIRGERRRQVREKEASEMNALNTSDAGLAEVAPILDQAINELAEDDRQAILLRFYERMDLRSVGEALGSSENAAQKRVARALEQLHHILTRRGVTLPATTLAAGLAVEAVTAAPAGLAGSVAGVALASVAAGGGTTTALLRFMAMTKVKAALVAAAIAAAAIPTLIQHCALDRVRQENARLISELAAKSVPPASSGAQPDQGFDRLRAQQSELLRLRGEVTRLRQQLADASVASLKPPGSEGVKPAPTDSPGNDSATNDFSSEVHTQVKFGETLVTGGWATSSGKRMLVFMKPELRNHEDNAPTVVLTLKKVELAEATLAQNGLQNLATGSVQTQEHGGTYANADADQLLQRILGEPGAQLLGGPRIETSSGNGAELFQGTESEYIKVSATPTLNPEASSIDLALRVQIRRPGSDEQSR